MPYDTDPSTVYYNVDSPTDVTCKNVHVHVSLYNVPVHVHICILWYVFVHGYTSCCIDYSNYSNFVLFILHILKTLVSFHSSPYS